MTWFCMQTGKSIHMPKLQKEMFGVLFSIAVIGIVTILFSLGWL